CDAASHLSLDAQGWPETLRYRDDASLEYSSIDLLINSSGERSDIGQRFVATWQGNGRVEIMGGLDVEHDDERRRLTFTLGPSETLVRLAEIDPGGTGDYLRDIRVFRADFEPLLDAGEVFDPDMLEFLRPFRSIRFMDWMQSNASGQCSGGSTPGASCYAVTSPDCGEGGRCLMPGHWGERPTEEAPSRLASGQYLDVSAPEQGTKVGGYALETLVALANRVPADPHFNLPIDYDEDYVRRFAEYLRDHLALGLTATVEYSNEVWNWQFPQAQFANAMGQAAWPEESTAWLQYMAGRTHTACRIIKDVFAGQEQRVRCVMSPQTTYRGLADTVLDCPLWAAEHPGEGACSRYVDAISITGYFAGCLVYHPEAIEGWLEEGRESAFDRAFEQLEHGGQIEACTGEDEDSLDRAIDNYRFFGDLATARGLGLYVYESGTHFNFDGDDSVGEFLVEMTRDERMYDLYTRNFDGFKGAGGSVLNVWGWVAPDDMWANADSVLDRSHPKYRAMRDYVGD
ncbi:MAG TPA: hypothetical protein VNN80_02455, partial [Polyangiaceae bacterium]|nr:hypothetical protein [Polyangiaceae bacterium]